jgi:hypothetical protein
VFSNVLTLIGTPFLRLLADVDLAVGVSGFPKFWFTYFSIVVFRCALCQACHLAYVLCSLVLVLLTSRSTHHYVVAL